MSNKPVNQATTEAGAVDGNVVKHSPKSGSGTNDKFASSVELAAALGESQELIARQNQEIAELRKQLSDGNKSNDNNAIAQLANLLKDLTAKPQQTGPTEAEQINKTTDFNSQKATIDGRSLVEAQIAVNSFRKEPKVPVSIPKSLSNTFGPYISMSVNGVRIAVPCDGKTYMINKTHAEHIRERMAKVDSFNSKPGEEVTIQA